jgi:polyadenylate-binding protein
VFAKLLLLIKTLLFSTKTKTNKKKIAMATEKRNYMYLYDLPKDKISSVKIAEAFKAEGVNIGDKKPQINRDLIKPFYSAVVHIEDAKMFELAKEKMRYPVFDGCQSRALPFDKDLRGEAKAKIQTHNIFVKLPKNVDRQGLTYKYLHDRFSQFGRIKSSKISLNEDFTPRGFAFVCFEDQDSTAKCLADLQASGEVFAYAPKDTRDVQQKVVNNLYFKNIPADMTEDNVKALFAPFGDIKSLVLFKNNIGQYGFVCYEDKNG